jgi:hypothetical protein
MPSTRALGRKNELRTKRLLEAEGYEVILAPNPTRYMKQVDFFGLWDAIATNGEHTRFIQVKSNKSSTYGKKLQPHRDWKNPPNSFKECWLFTKGFSKPEVMIL